MYIHGSNVDEEVVIVVRTDMVTREVVVFDLDANAVEEVEMAVEVEVVRTGLVVVAATKAAVEVYG